MKKFTAAEIAKLLGAELVGNGNEVITGVASLDNATSDDLSFFTNKKLYHDAVESKAAIMLVAKEFDRELPETKVLLKSETPNMDFSKVANLFAPPAIEYETGIHPTAIIAETAQVPASCHIGAYVVISKKTVIGENTKILDGVKISENVKIGNGCLIYQGVVIRENSEIGNNVIIHCNAVLGSDGYAYDPGPFGLIKVPQVGIVKIEDDVEIGANTTIDKARFGKTWIKTGAKIDNLVMIAHNVEIGEFSMIIGQAGLAGSVKVGSGVIMAGQSAASHGLKIGDGVKVAGQAGLTQDVPADSIMGGTPALTIREALAQKRAYKTLIKFKERIKELEAEVNEIKKTLKP
jgi:UDP-3-O-[3-hydroxymyristoyl] glucosamine N-acyltransferase